MRRLSLSAGPNADSMRDRKLLQCDLGVGNRTIDVHLLHYRRPNVFFWRLNFLLSSHCPEPLPMNSFITSIRKLRPHGGKFQLQISQLHRLASSWGSEACSSLIFTSRMAARSILVLRATDIFKKLVEILYTSVNNKMFTLFPSFMR